MHAYTVQGTCIVQCFTHYVMYNWREFLAKPFQQPSWYCNSTSCVLGLRCSSVALTCPTDGTGAGTSFNRGITVLKFRTSVGAVSCQGWQIHIVIALVICNGLCWWITSLRIVGSCQSIYHHIPFRWVGVAKPFDLRSILNSFAFSLFFSLSLFKIIEGQFNQS